MEEQLQKDKRCINHFQLSMKKTSPKQKKQKKFKEKVERKERI